KRSSTIWRLHSASAVPIRTRPICPTSTARRRSISSRRSAECRSGDVTFCCDVHSADRGGILSRAGIVDFGRLTLPGIRLFLFAPSPSDQLGDLFLVTLPDLWIAIRIQTCLTRNPPRHSWFDSSARI